MHTQTNKSPQHYTQKEIPKSKSKISAAMVHTLSLSYMFCISAARFHQCTNRQTA